VDLDDRIMISTPEGIELALTLAGLGSRFIAGAADLIIQGVVIGILALLTAGATGFIPAVTIVLAFVVWFLYPILFEVLAAGRTPGKRWTHLRVVRESGAPVDLAASAIRNLMRLLDGPLLLYLPTIISIVVTERNQRPGDLAAGTVVIRESPGALAPSSRAAAAESSGPGWDVSAITPEEVATVRRFLERRESLDPAARQALARRLATGLAPKVSGSPPGLSDEAFLEQLTHRKMG
jgi:uncharacterized RDD family membrane protein YckC